METNKSIFSYINENLGNDAGFIQKLKEKYFVFFAMKFEDINAELMSILNKEITHRKYEVEDEIVKYFTEHVTAKGKYTEVVYNGELPIEHYSGRHLRGFKTIVKINGNKISGIVY